MKQKKKKYLERQQVQEAGTSSVTTALRVYAPAVILALTLFFSPLFPDEKLNRWKLIALGTGLILCCVAWAVSKILDKEFVVYRTPLDIPLLAYTVTASFFYGASANPSVASSEFQRMIFSVGAYFAAVQVCSGERAEKMRRISLSGWLAGLILIAIYGVLQKSGGVGTIMVPKMDRVFGTFGNPIFFAAFLIISVPFLIGWMLETRKWMLKLTLAGGIVVSLWALFYTGTRAAFLSLPIALALFYVVLEWKRGWAWTRGLWQAKKLLLGASVILAVLIFFAAGRSQYRGLIAKVNTALTESRVTATSQTHTLIWKDVLKMWKAHPIFGTGYGTFHIEFPQYASEELKRVYPQRERIVNDAHNEYLQILAESGITGFAVFMSVLIVFYFFALKYIFSAEDTGLYLFSGITCGATALLVQNFFSVDMRFIVSSTYIFLAMGIAAGYFARPFRFEWTAGPGSALLKAVCLAAVLLLSGVFGIKSNPLRVYLAGVYEFSSGGQGEWQWQKTSAAGPGLWPALVRPYLARRAMDQTPDFFDQKVLDSAKTISELEKLTHEQPDQWKFWEKLGYVYAKEIQRQDAQGRKMNDHAIAEKAAAAYAKAFNLNPAAQGPPNNIANIFYTIGRRGEAIQWWSKAIEIDPENIDARVNLGQAYYFEGKIKESALQFEQVLKRDPKNEKAIVMLKRMVE